MKKRVSNYPVDSLILNRWSPRFMSGESLDDAELMTLFEAARWAPSSYNGQPWRFIYAKKKTPFWQSFFDLMDPSNQKWAQHAAVLVIVCSRVNFTFNNKPSRTHSFDTGAACENLALQAERMNLALRAIGGFDYDKAVQLLDLSKDYTVEVMLALGRVQKESLESQELTDRKPLKDIVFEGTFKEVDNV